LFFAPDLHGLLKNAYVLYDLNGVIHDRQVIDPPVLQDHLNHPVLEAYLRKIVIDHGIGIVHFHHLLRQVPSLIGILAEMGVPSLVTLHDYYSVCDRHTLLNQHDEYCDIFGKPQVDCDTCLFQMTGIQAGSQSVRRFAYEAALMKAEKLIFNTLGVAENHKKILKNIDARRFVVVGAPSKTVFRSPVQRSFAGKIKVLVPNGLSRMKGGARLRRAGRKIESRSF
jgi:hypothetical protein